MNDITCEYITNLRKIMPRISQGYNTDGSIQIRDIKKDLKGINELIQVYNTLRDSMHDIQSRINYNISEYNKMKQEVTQVVSESGLGRLNSSNLERPILDNVSLMDYVEDNPRQSEKVLVSPGVYIDAIQVSDKSMIRADGLLYHIKSLDKFGFWLNGHLMIGNIGEIYSHEKCPQKIKVCSGGSNCKNINKCTYYHAGTKDIRNFISGSFVYNRTQKSGRNIGSRSSLMTDVNKATSQDIELLNDQAVHEILCNLVTKSIRENA